MLFYLFSPGVLARLFERLGYEYRPDTAARNIAYYDQRTSHGSTLSFVTFAGVLAALDPESSWERFLVALHSDVEDVQGGTTQEGIHMGVMAGTLDLMQRAYPGTEIRDGVLHFQPRLPAQRRAGGVPDAVSAHPAARVARPRPAHAQRSTGREPAVRSESAVGDEVARALPRRHGDLRAVLAGRSRRARESEA